MPTAEIELKLLGDREDLADFASSPAVARYARDAGNHTDLIATYYDTADLALRKSGAVLRVRTDGKRSIMTLKSSHASGNGLERTEWTAPVQSMEPDLAALAQFLPAETFAKLEDAPLNPVFKTEVRRFTRMLDTPLGTVELAVDPPGPSPRGGGVQKALHSPGRRVLEAAPAGKGQQVRLVALVHGRSAAWKCFQADRSSGSSRSRLLARQARRAPAARWPAQFLDRDAQFMALLRREFPEVAATLQGLATELPQNRGREMAAG